MTKRASSVAMLRSIQRLSGRAPYAGSKLALMTCARASSVALTRMLRSDSRVLTMIASCCRTMAVRLLTWSGSKMTSSSMRLRNSGRKWRLSSRNTCSLAWRMLSCWPAGGRSSSSDSVSCGAQPLRRFLRDSVSAASTRNCEPRLEVMMMMVLSKLTTSPLLSVRRPSSNTWSRMLKTSGWAFSTSSKSTTEYGRRRTASVSWPPSSWPM
mmetsp:Transcript_17729/g.56663  ORF Transcript_17729/g.56663 Transcript_17729/m.56663 type:complete len:211 (+) Transcript_17729:346-978(+)